MKLTYSPALKPGPAWLILRAVEPGERDALRWEWATGDGEALTTFTSRRFGPGSNARLLAQTLIDEEISDALDTDQLVGKQLWARIVEHPSGDWRLRMAEVRSQSGQVGGKLLSKNGLSWDDVTVEILKN